MSAKPLLFAPQHKFWQLRLAKERKSAFRFHDQDLYNKWFESFPKYLETIDKRVRKNYRMQHPVRYHPPPSEASHTVTVRSSKTSHSNVRPKLQNTLVEPQIAKQKQVVSQQTVEGLLKDNENLNKILTTINQRQTLKEAIERARNLYGEQLPRGKIIDDAPYAVIEEADIVSQMTKSKRRRHKSMMQKQDLEKIYSQKGEDRRSLPQSRIEISPQRNQEVIQETNPSKKLEIYRVATPSYPTRVATPQMPQRVQTSIPTNRRSEDRTAVHKHAREILLKLEEQLEKERLEGSRLRMKLEQLKKTAQTPQKIIEARPF